MYPEEQLKTVAKVKLTDTASSVFRILGRDQLLADETDSAISAKVSQTSKGLDIYSYKYFAFSELKQTSC